MIFKQIVVLDFPIDGEHEDKDGGRDGREDHAADLHRVGGNETSGFQARIGQPISASGAGSGKGDRGDKGEDGHHVPRIWLSELGQDAEGGAIIKRKIQMIIVPAVEFIICELLVACGPHKELPSRELNRLRK